MKNLIATLNLSSYRSGTNQIPPTRCRRISTLMLIVCSKSLRTTRLLRNHGNVNDPTEVFDSEELAIDVSRSSQVPKQINRHVPPQRKQQLFRQRPVIKCIYVSSS